MNVGYGEIGTGTQGQDRTGQDRAGASLSALSHHGRVLRHYFLSLFGLFLHCICTDTQFFAGVPGFGTKCAKCVDIFSAGWCLARPAFDSRLSVCFCLVFSLFFFLFTFSFPLGSLWPGWSPSSYLGQRDEGFGTRRWAIGKDDGRGRGRACWSCLVRVSGWGETRRTKLNCG
jgi:hypothetical protein